MWLRLDERVDLRIDHENCCLGSDIDYKQIFVFCGLGEIAVPVNHRTGGKARSYVLFLLVIRKKIAEDHDQPWTLWVSM